MRKANKIVMMTVAILLSAVLLTTSALSGTLAKYVTSGGSYSDSARVAKWGVTITADVRDDLAEIATVTGEDGSATVTIAGLNMKPGDDFSDAVRFTITGDPEVKCKVTVQTRVRYGIDPKNSRLEAMKVVDSAGLEGTWHFMPVGLTFGTGYYNSTSKAYTPVKYGTNLNYVYLTNPWLACKGDTKGSSLAPDVMMGNFKTGIQSKIDGSEEAGTADYGGMSRTLEPTEELAFYTNNVNGTKTKVNSFVFGFVFPYEYSNTTYDALLTQDKLDEVATYISDHSGEDFVDSKSVTWADGRFKFVVQYQIIIEQVQ